MFELWILISKRNGFNIRVVNAYAPTEVNGTDSQKQSLYSLLSKAIQKTQKHQKLVVLGDFNATTHIAKLRCFFDGKKIIADPDCNDNGNRLKSFCRSHQLSISNTFSNSYLYGRNCQKDIYGRSIFVFNFVIFRPHIVEVIIRLWKKREKKKNKYKKLTLKCYIDVR